MSNQFVQAKSADADSLLLMYSVMKQIGSNNEEHIAERCDQIPLMAG
jgi:hypothetical protein